MVTFIPCHTSLDIHASSPLANCRRALMHAICAWYYVFGCYERRWVLDLNWICGKRAQLKVNYTASTVICKLYFIGDLRYAVTCQIRGYPFSFVQTENEKWPGCFL